MEFKILKYYFDFRSENDRIVPVWSKSFYGIKSDPADPPSLGSRSANKPSATKVKTFLKCLQNRLKYAGLEPVLGYTKNHVS